MLPTDGGGRVNTTYFHEWQKCFSRHGSQPRTLLSTSSSVLPPRLQFAGYSLAIPLSHILCRSWKAKTCSLPSLRLALRTATMHSPLPDSSVLEAGLIEDPVPPILSRVQDNVRNLLRSSHFSAIVDDDLPPLPRRGRLGVAKEVATPERAHSRSLPSSVVEVVESPSSGSTTSIPTTSTPTTTMPQPAVPGVLFPPSTYTQDLRREAHHAGSESVAMLSHPDLTEQSSTTYVQHKSERRQQQSYKRSKANKRRAQAGSGQSIFAVLAALLLASIVATCKFCCCICSPRRHS